MKKFIAAMTAGVLMAAPAGLFGTSTDKAVPFTVSAADTAAAKPVLSLPDIVISPEDAAANRDVMVSLTVSDAFKKYATVEIWTVFDSRLTIAKDQSGNPAASSGDALRLLKSYLRPSAYYDQSEGKLVDLNGVRLIAAGTANYGLDGTLFTVKVTLPENVKEGDRFPLKFFYADKSTTNNNFANSMFNNIANDEAGQQMQKWVFENGLKEGCITIGDAPSASYGDANCDGKINVSDAVAVLQYASNKLKYSLEAQGLVNADVDGDSGITGSDGLVIQQVDAGVLKQSDLPLGK